MSNLRVMLRRVWNYFFSASVVVVNQVPPLLPQQSLVSTKVFAKYWTALFIIGTVVTLLGLFLVSIFWLPEKVEVPVKTEVFENIFYWFFAWPIIFGFLVWSNRFIVQPEWNHIYTWNGHKMEPLVPGVYFLFPYGGFLEEVAEVPMNRRTLFILSGVRDGLSTDITNQYVYGNSSNLEPAEGSALRLMYKVEIQCLDPILLTYSQADPYAYISGVIELEVNIYVHGRKSEKIIDGFARRKWDTLLLPKVRNIVSPVVGVNLLSFIPVDVILTPENEKSRSDVEIEERKIRIIEAQLKNKKKEEEGQKEILEAQLINMSVKKEIGKEANIITANKIDTIKTTAGVNGVVALNFVNNDKKLDTILEASKKGNITYVDDSGKGSMSQATAMGFAINANNNK